LKDLQSDLPLGDAAQARVERKVVQSAIPKEEKRRKDEVAKLNSIKKLLAELPKQDPKIEALLSALKTLLADGAEKAIVFTEYTDTLDAVKEVLRVDGNLAQAFVVLQGGMSGRQRAKVQEDFEKPEIRLLLATDAASEGLNLQRQCRAVFHFELPWNPNRMEQRNGRVDRYGQARGPIIRYLYYPDSAEDGVLSRLALKMEQMRKDRVSTPDLLGVHQGDGSLCQGLVYLDAEDGGASLAAENLVTGFEERVADFERNVQPLLLAESGLDEELKSIAQGLNQAGRLLGDDLAWEEQMKLLLGPSLSRTLQEGVYRLDTPRLLRGLGVESVYPRLTFRRSLAVKTRPDELEFVGRRHPLVLAAAAEARRNLIQVYSGERGRWPRRLAARRVAKSEPLSVLFTCLVELVLGDGQVHEQWISLRVGLDAQVLKAGEMDWSLLQGAPGEVPAALLERVFKPAFSSLAALAQQETGRRAEVLAEALAVQRQKRAALLLKDAQEDLAGRLAMIAREESRAEGRLEESGQARLFAEQGYRADDWEKRRQVARRQAEERERVLAAYQQVKVQGTPRISAALFLVPEGLA
jgi:hypothetical protein